MNLSDTIVACSSPPGASARGLVRLSGGDAWSIVEAMSATAHRPVARARGVATHRLLNGWPCLLLRFPGPHNYTGEDTIELAVPGNPTLVARVVALATEHGARRAEPGEFTARAWLNGRLTLTQAEGVAALVSAASDAQLRAAHVLRENRLGRVAAELCERLAGALALVEAGIDFTEEEDVVAIGAEDLRGRLAFIVNAIDETLDRAVGSESLSALPRVVLVGPPNAGKSTLYNALLGRRRAVVSDERGTTRDVLVEPMHLDSADPLSPEVLLVDVAGLDESPLGLNPQMQAAAHEAIRRADLLVQLEPTVREGDERPATCAAARPDVLRLVVRSKSDLLSAKPAAQDESASVIRLSALTGEGLGDLRRRIGAALAGRTASLAAETMALLPRHEDCLREARRHLVGAESLLESQIQETGQVRFPSRSPILREAELLAASMRSALDALGMLAGVVSPDDVLGRIFAGFCIGK